MSLVSRVRWMKIDPNQLGAVIPRRWYRGKRTYWRPWYHFASCLCNYDSTNTSEPYLEYKTWLGPTLRITCCNVIWKQIMYFQISVGSATSGLFSDRKQYLMVTSSASADTPIHNDGRESPHLPENYEMSAIERADKEEKGWERKFSSMFAIRYGSASEHDYHLADFKNSAIHPNGILHIVFCIFAQRMAAFHATWLYKFWTTSRNQKPDW